MANGYSVLPINDKQLADQTVTQYLADCMIFVPENLRHGRFPTITELRESIQELGYSLEEGGDWYVTSEDDFTEIWFNGDNKTENSPIDFWFRRGGLIVLDIAQSISNRCGSLVVASHSGSPVVLLVPDTVFPASPQVQGKRGFITAISRRLPVMIDRLTTARHEEALFILSQIRQALRSMDYLRNNEYFRSAEQGLTAYRRLLTHEDPRVRYLAFDLLTKFRQHFYEHSESLRLSIQNESDSNTKEKMVNAIENLIVPGWIGSEIDQWTRSLLDLLRDLSDNATEAPAVRLAAANLLARAQAGLQTLAMHIIFVDALIQPEKYRQDHSSPYSVLEAVLKSIENLLLNHRIDVLMAALPQIMVAQYAHDVLRALLDHAFFGAIRPTQMSGLPDTQPAERPDIDETKMDITLSRNWLYPANPTRLNPAELLPTQRTVLKFALGLDVPWMVHSNLLEKYGLPPTRASVRAWLETNQ